MGRKEKPATDDPEKKIDLPPAKSIFNVCMPSSDGAVSSEAKRGDADLARTGELLGNIETPCFTVFTSRGFPFYLRPEVMTSVMGNGKQLWQVPMGDAFLRTDSVKQCEKGEKGCKAFWPHLENHVAYCSFRNIRMNPSIFGGDAVCSVETRGGRRKVGPKEWLDVQRVLKMDLIAAPAEEVPLEAGSHRKVHRSVNRAAAWLQEILEAKATDESLAFDWNVLASIQGCGDAKVRQKACVAAAALPVAGFVVGGLGYEESLANRAAVLEVATANLPAALPRFLPLNQGTPIEVLQGVLLGIDVFEITYPIELAFKGIALTFDLEMLAEEGDPDVSALAALLPEQPKAAESAEPSKTPAEQAATAAAASASTAAAAGKVVRQMYLHKPECREDFGPITAESPVKQYSRAYLCHLIEVRELLGTMLLAHHNTDLYVRFFATIRSHIRKGTMRRFAAWFMRTQLMEPPTEPVSGPAAKKRKT